MKLKFITSACVEIEYTNGFRVLCDPWLTEGIFYGTWYHNPKLQKDWIEYYQRNPPDAIYISHIHQDHCDVFTLSQLVKSSTILIANFEDKALLNLLKKAWGVSYEYPYTANIDKSLIKIIKADGLECDSFALFKDPTGVQILNLNDCVYTDVKEQLKKLPKGVDLALLPYSGASCFPQCFDDLSHEEKLHEKANVEQKYLNWYRAYQKDIKPLETMPFAGQYKLVQEQLNQYLAIPPMPEDGLIPKEGQEYYIGMDKLITFADIKFMNHYNGKSGLMIKTEKKLYVVRESMNGNDLMIKMTEKLLWECLTKRKHWNNVELGNFLRFERKGSYDKELHYSLSFLHI